MLCLYITILLIKKNLLAFLSIALYHKVIMKKRNLATILLIANSLILSACSSLADNPILAASAASPNNWIARAIYLASVQAKTREESEAIKSANSNNVFFKKSIDELSMSESVELAKLAESKRLKDIAAIYWFISGCKGYPDGYLKTAIYAEKSGRSEVAYECYLLAHMCGVKGANECAQKLEYKFSERTLSELKKDAGEIYQEQNKAQIEKRQHNEN